MKLNDFIKNHMKIDKRNKSLNKLKNTCDSYYQIYTYLSKVMISEYSLIFYILKKEDNIFYSKVSDIMPPHKFSKFMKYLVNEDMIIKEQDTKINFTHNRPNIYILTKKGLAFLELKIVKDFMEENYK